jgi:parvulin-like peptidyl-prolyl isomerase
MTRNGFRNLFAPGAFKARLGMILGGLCVLAACGIIRYYWGTSAAKAQNSGEPDSPATVSGTAASGDSSPAAARSESVIPGRVQIPDVVASVDGHAITRDELAAECRLHYGKEVLESMVNKYLILSACRQMGITISRREVEDEINQMAKSFNLPREQWMKLLMQERGIKPEQYADDIIWPSLALRKLAGERLQVTQKELTEAFEMEYGAAVKARLIVCTSAENARKIQSLAAANPAGFGDLAKKYSEDGPSASIKGIVPPIRKHSACPEIEEAAFGLADGQVSGVIPSAGQYVILKRDGLIVARAITMAKAAPRLEKIIRDRKMRQVATDIFQDLQRKAQVQNVLNHPSLRQQVGQGVVALVNNSPIYLRQLDEVCMTRHGAEVLQGLIGRRMLELECKQHQVTVSEPEIDAEIARAAAQLTNPLPDGSPDVKKWLALAVKQQGVSVETYRNEVVWPAVALKKLAVGKIDITDEDLKKGFQANYGPRVRCRAIVLNNLRRAQEAWESARRNPTLENFGDLAEKYSIERSSRALRGEVPPIRRFGGQPILEEEAFALKPGDISGIIQLDDKFIILLCESYTKPIDVDFASVKKDIFEDIREKKERLAMNEYYERMQDRTVIDNFIDPAASHSPSKGVSVQQPSQVVPTAYNAPTQK